MIVRPIPLHLAHPANQPKSPGHAHALFLTQTNARLGSHLGFDAWNLTTSSGSTIETAINFAMSIHFSLSTGAGSLEGPTTMVAFLPSVGAGAVVYGEGDENTREKYVSFLEREEENYPAHPWFFWNQPLDDSGWVATHNGSSGAGATTPTPTSSSMSSISPSGPTSGTPTASAANQDKGNGTAEGTNDGERVLLGAFGRLFLGAVTLASLLVLLFA